MWSPLGPVNVAALKRWLLITCIKQSLAKYGLLTTLQRIKYDQTCTMCTVVMFRCAMVVC